jgi:hypothetical protein
VLGGADVVSMVIRSSLVQLRTPDEMRGRVSAVSSLFTGTSNQLGEFAPASPPPTSGAVPAVLIGGLGSILVASLWTVSLSRAPRHSHAGRLTREGGSPGLCSAPRCATFKARPRLGAHSPLTS